MKELVNWNEECRQTKLNKLCYINATQANPCGTSCA